MPVSDLTLHAMLHLAERSTLATLGVLQKSQRGLQREHLEPAEARGWIAMKRTGPRSDSLAYSLTEAGHKWLQQLVALSDAVPPTL